MKKILYFLLVFTVAFAILGSTIAFAEEVIEGAEAPSSETVADEVNLFTRLYEAFQDNKTDIFTLGGSAILFVISIILKKDLGATSKSVIDNIARVLSKTDISVEQQRAMVNGLNEMVDGYDEIKLLSVSISEKLSNYDKQMQTVINSNAALENTMNQWFDLLSSLVEKGILQNADVMEVLTSICTNSKHMPQGIKDYSVLKRADSAKLVKEAANIVRKDEGGAVNE